MLTLKKFTRSPGAFRGKQITLKTCDVSHPNTTNAHMTPRSGEGRGEHTSAPSGAEEG